MYAKRQGGQLRRPSRGPSVQCVKRGLSGELKTCFRSYSGFLTTF